MNKVTTWLVLIVQVSALISIEETIAVISDVVRLRLSEESASRSDVNSLPAPPPHLIPQQNWGGSAMVGNHRLLLPPSGTPNSSRKSPINNGLMVPRSSGPGVFPTGPFTADNSIYGVITTPGPPAPSWRLTEDSLASLRHMGDVWSTSQKSRFTSL